MTKVLMLLGGSMLARALAIALALAISSGSALAVPTKATPRQTLSPTARVLSAPPPRERWGSRIYHSVRLKQFVNSVPRPLGYVVEAGAMLTCITLGGLDLVLHGRRP